MCHLKPIQRINAVFFWLTWFGGICFAIFRTLPFKIPASACFLILGILNTVYARNCRLQRSFRYAMLAGLILGFFADIALQLDFYTGTGLFALGHIAYISAFCALLPVRKKDFLVVTALCVPSLGLILYLPCLDYGGSLMLAIVIVYALVICMMLGKALSNLLRSPSSMMKWIAFGSFLFFFSDLMLLFAFYSDVGRIANILCLNTYYPGQAILAASIFLSADTQS